MNKTTSTKPAIEAVVRDILATIEREREREIIARRFGLFDRKETLEQIGELLGITRERVRQLEKAVVARLKAQAESGLPHIEEIQREFTVKLKALGDSARIVDLSALITDQNTKVDQARVSFLTQLCPNLVIVDENDNYFQSVAIRGSFTDQNILEYVDSIVETIKKLGSPASIEEIHTALQNDKLSVEQTRGLASVSKQVANLNNRWGLIRWPMVNPKNIRDKIYLILHDGKKPLHFSDIAAAIKGSTFKRRDVTTQAIHNELIKDKRFVLIGRGIYALKEWGYDRGTVADIISDVLRKEGKPLHRDEIVKRVLKHRIVKETTILLNLQGKSQFKRVAKATYALAE